MNINEEQQKELLAKMNKVLEDGMNQLPPEIQLRITTYSIMLKTLTSNDPAWYMAMSLCAVSFVEEKLNQNKRN